jgi:4,5-dihydroxyphthalate decarboxylase
MSTRIPLTLACWDYDRTRALATGEIQPEGVDLTYLSLPVEETFFRMMRYQEFDVAEMSLSSYVLSLSSGAPATAIPVFPSRSFRHNGIYVNAASGIEQPSDLAGRVIGIPEYQLTAVVWVRGILAEHYGVPLESAQYRTGGLDNPGRVEKLQVNVPAGVDVQPIPAHRTLSEMLVSGEIDAVYCPRTPRPFAERRPEVRRLFADPRAEEERYFAQTGIFPIMHTVVLRRDVYERHRWLAQSLFKAFESARAQTAARLAETAASPCMIPWLYDEAERTRRLMGPDFWSYGLEPNAGVLRTFLRYAREQGLTDRDLDPAGLFVPETHAAYVI